MQFGKLEIRLLNYFLLIAIAAMMIGLEFFLEIGSPELIEEVSNHCQQTICNSSEQITKTTSPTLSNLRNKIVIMFGVLTVVVAIVLMMFIKNITIPLSNIAIAAKKINDGDLSQVINVHIDDEISDVGTAINELASNLQEVARFSSTTTSEAIEKLDKLIARGDESPPTIEEIISLRQDLNYLNEFTNSFELLHTDVKK